MNRKKKYSFRLYVTGVSPNSVQAEANLTALCKTHLTGRYEIEVVDVLKAPMVALNDNVLMTPTLVKFSPPPVRRIIGSLSQMQAVLDIILDIIGDQVGHP
jgi:circadian clock protein KaiB